MTYREFTDITLTAAERAGMLLERPVGQVLTCFAVMFFSVSVAILASHLKMSQLEAGALTLLGGAGGVIFAVLKQNHPSDTPTQPKDQTNGSTSSIS